MYYKIKSINNLDKIPLNFNEPVLIKNGCKTMNAIYKWNLEYLKKEFNNCIVPIEFYLNHNDMNKSIINSVKNESFNDFCDNYLFSKNPNYYLAELDILKYKNKISKNIFNDTKFKYDIQRKSNASNFFLGYNSKSGCHAHFSDDYMLNQIFGTKIVYMFDYNDNSNLIIKKKHIYSHFLNIDIFNLDSSKYKIYKVVLNPGDSLLIPPWWYHSVKGNGLTCSLTNVYTRSNYLYLLNKPYIILTFCDMYKLYLISLFILLFIIYLCFYYLKKKYL